MPILKQQPSFVLDPQYTAWNARILSLASSFSQNYLALLVDILDHQLNVTGMLPQHMDFLVPVVLLDVSKGVPGVGVVVQIYTHEETLEQLSMFLFAEGHQGSCEFSVSGLLVYSSLAFSLILFFVDLLSIKRSQ